jgi:methionyl-tRNA synthetase
VIANYGSDAVRHFLVTCVPIFADSDFSTERLAQSYTIDLANRLGNLYSRLRVLCEKADFSRWVKSTNAVSNQVESLLQLYGLAEIAQLAWGEIDRLNAEVGEQRP